MKLPHRLRALAAFILFLLALLWWRADGRMRLQAWRNRDADFRSFRAIEALIAKDERALDPPDLPGWLRGLDDRCERWFARRPLQHLLRPTRPTGDGDPRASLRSRYAAEALAGDRLALFKLALTTGPSRSECAVALLDRLVGPGHPLLDATLAIRHGRTLAAEGWSQRARAAAALRRGLALGSHPDDPPAMEALIAEAAGLAPARPGLLERAEQAVGPLPASDLRALNALAMMDGREYARLLERAADAGCPEAGSLFALLLIQGSRIPRDLERAAALLCRTGGNPIPVLRTNPIPASPPAAVLRDPLECGNLSRLAFTVDGRTLVAAGRTVVLLFDLPPTGDAEASRALVTNPVEGLSPDGRFVLTRSGEELLVIDVGRGAEAAAFAIPDAWRTRPLSCAFDATGRFARLHDRDTLETRLLDLAAPRLIPPGDPPRPPGELRFDPPPPLSPELARHVEENTRLPMDGNPLKAHAVSADGRLLATTDGDGVQLWDLAPAAGPATPGWRNR